MMFFGITSIFSSLGKIAANLTGKQYELVKWRTSKEAKQYYSRKENIEFYKALKKGDLSVVDAIEKEKQQRINDLKQQFLKCIVIILFLSILNSCSMIPKKQNTWDENSLLTNEKTYQLKSQNIKVKNQLSSVPVDDNYYIVHRDYIKTFNQNQDDLLASLNKLKDQDKYMKIGLGSMVIILVIIILFILKRSKR